MGSVSPGVTYRTRLFQSTVGVMRKIVNVLFAVAVLGVVGCRKNDEKVSANDDVMTFTGRIADGGVKTEIDDLEVVWNDDDKVIINDSVFESEPEGGAKTAIFIGQAVSAPYKAYYPTSLKVDGSFVLPTIQHYDIGNGNNLSQINPLYAESNTTDLLFHNICALVKLVVTGTGTVKTITVTADQPLSGKFAIGKETIGKNTYYYAKVDDDGAKTVVLNCGTNGVVLDGANATTFYIALPQGEYTKLKFTLGDGTGGTWRSTPTSMKLKAGNLRTKELKGVSIGRPVGALPGIFSVSADRKVLFSKGNLQATYNGYAYIWGFAANQFDHIGAMPGNSTIKSDGTNDVNAVVDMFGWSTASTYYGINLSISDSDYSGSFRDWGENIGDGLTWYTPSGGDGGDWQYLIEKRATTYGTGTMSVSNRRFAAVKVNSVCGILLFPDEFSWPLSGDVEPTVFNHYSSNWNGRNYTVEEFVTLESAGCAFLPVTGSRSGNDVGNVATHGHYWTSTPKKDEDLVHRFYFRDEIVGSTYSDVRHWGFSVRLVCPV